MLAEHTLRAIKDFCMKSSGDEQIWTNKGTTYHWNRGRVTNNGLINGVVRKLAGVDGTGAKIWTVAGSIKITPDGNIVRWTGLPSDTQRLLEGMARIKAEAELKVGT